MSRHDEAVRLRHMLDAARKAVALTAGKSRTEIETDEIAQLALARLLEIVGEASRGVSAGYQQTHAEIPWAAIRGPPHPGRRPSFPLPPPHAPHSTHPGPPQRPAQP